MILIWANFNAQSFIHLKLSIQSSELFFYVSTCLQQQCHGFGCACYFTVHFTLMAKLNFSESTSSIIQLLALFS